MMVTVALSVHEDYPHLFVSTDADEIASRFSTIVELTEEEWADYQQAADRYDAWIARLEDMRMAAGGRLTS